jgi:hypothetical protein
LTTGAGFTNYGYGSATLDFAIKIVLCWATWTKKWLKRKKVLKVKEGNFQVVGNKHIWDKKDVQIWQKC